MAGWTPERRERTQAAELARPRTGPPHLVVDNATAQLQLSHIIEREIIPRLMLLHGGLRPWEEPQPLCMLVTAAHVETLTRLAVEREAEPSRDFVRRLQADGVRPEDIFLQLLSPAAELMGRLWLDDVYSFSEVTLGLWRLQQILHEQSERCKRQHPQGEGHRVLIAPHPGSQHTFGASMLAEFFIHEGWQARLELGAGWADLENLLAGDWFEVLGLSVGVDSAIPSVASAILRLRDVSCNPNLFVMVGGPAALSSPDLAVRCGADAAASDATVAVSLAKRSLGLMSRAPE